jgi:cation transport ATPase
MNMTLKSLIASSAFVLSTLAAHAEYDQVKMTVFGMDCAPCAHAIHVSMKGIRGVNTVDVDLNTGLVVIKLAPGNAAAMRQFNEAVEKNGFTHKDAVVTARGKLTGTASAPFFEVSGTQDRFAVTAAAGGTNIGTLLGKTVTITGVLPQAAKGKVPVTLRYNTIAEAR